MHGRFRRLLAHTSSLAAGLLTVGVLAGCADLGSTPPAADPPPSTSVDEVAAHDGKVCPKRLPESANADHGLGADESAESAPSLSVPESAWVCRYDPAAVGPGPEGDGTTYGWVRAGEVRPVDPARLLALQRDLTELAPAERNRVCTADLGPRWMLVYSHGNDLTGVVVDDFGCRDVRLTDEPFETVPGDATQPGTTRGVLAGPAALLIHLRAVHGH